MRIWRTDTDSVESRRLSGRKTFRQDIRLEKPPEKKRDREIGRRPQKDGYSRR